MRGTLTLGFEVAAKLLLAPPVLAARWLGLEQGVSADAELPAAPISLATTIKGGLDELFFVSELLTARFVAGAESSRVAAEIATALAVFESRGWLAVPAHYYGTPPPLEDVTLQDARSLGRDYQHLTFASDYEPWPDEPGRARWLGYAANRTAHAWVLEHAGGARPWLVCLHGYRTGFPLTDFIQFSPAWLHRALGLNVVVPVLPLHGPRTAGRRSGEGFVSGDFLDTMHLQAQAVWDVRRLLDWVKRRRASTIGIYGLSLGGTTAALIAGLEPDLACVIAGVPAHDLVGLAERHVPAFVRQLAARLGVSWDGVARLLAMVSPLALPPRVAYERRFLLGAAGDRLVPAAQLGALWRHWERPHLAWHDGSHVSFILEPTVRVLVQKALVATGMIAPDTA